MKKIFVLFAVMLGAVTAWSQETKDPLSVGAGGVATVVGETHTMGDPKSVTDTATVTVPKEEVPLWKQKLYYGYNFDIYYHHDSRSERTENGWSIALQPEIGWKLKERLYLGIRLSGSYANTVTDYSMDTVYISNLRVHHGTWEVAPYVRYRMKSLFDGKLGIWLEARVFTGMEFPRAKWTSMT